MTNTTSQVIPNDFSHLICECGHRWVDHKDPAGCKECEECAE